MEVPSYLLNYIRNLNKSTGGNVNYNDVTNKPEINGVILEGNKSLNELGIQYITDLGNINAEDYEDDLSLYMNTLTESGLYHFVWDNGDGYEYIIRVEAIPTEDNSYIEVNQHYWGTEEGAITEYIRALTIEDGEVTSETTTSYLTMNMALTVFANKNHVHYRTIQKPLSVWDFCVGSEISIQTNSPILYNDTRSPRHNWLIDTTSAISSPNNRFIRVTDLADPSVIYQISGVYSAGSITWCSWYKFTGTTFNPT